MVTSSSSAPATIPPVPRIKYKFPGNNQIYQMPPPVSSVAPTPPPSLWKDVTNPSFWSDVAQFAWDGTSWNGGYTSQCRLSLNNGINGMYGNVVSWQIGYRPTKMRLTFTQSGIQGLQLYMWMNDTNTTISLSPTSGEAIEIGLENDLKQIAFGNAFSFNVTKIEFYFDPNANVSV